MKKRFSVKAVEIKLCTIWTVPVGVYLGFNLFKKRIKNSSIPTGKSGGFRVIIYKQVEDKIILISIYSKTEKENLSDEELSDIIKKYMKN